MSGAATLEPDGLPEDDRPPGELPPLTEADLAEFLGKLDGFETKPVLEGRVLVNREKGLAVDMDEVIGVDTCEDDGYGVLLLAGGSFLHTPYAAPTLLEFWLEFVGA